MTDAPDFDRYLTHEEQQEAARTANARAAVFVHESKNLLAAAVTLYYDLLRYQAVLERASLPETGTLREELQVLRAENESLRQSLAEQTALAGKYAAEAEHAAEECRSVQQRAAQREAAREQQLAALTEALAAAQKAAKESESPDTLLTLENERLRRENELHLQTIRKQGTQLRRMKLQTLQQKADPPTESEET